MPAAVASGLDSAVPAVIDGVKFVLTTVSLERAASGAGSEFATGVVVAAGLDLAALFNGAPTAISQRWPGSPCLGFIPVAVAEFVLSFIGLVFIGVLVTAGELLDFVAGEEFNGAPTAISQRWPGSPCLGLSAEPDDAPTGTCCAAAGAFRETVEDACVLFKFAAGVAKDLRFGAVTPGNAGNALAVEAVPGSGSPTPISQRWPGWP